MVIYYLLINYIYGDQWYKVTIQVTAFQKKPGFYVSVSILYHYSIVLPLLSAKVIYHILITYMFV